MSRSRRAQRGMVMAMALGVVAVFITLGAGFLVRSLHESLMSNRNVNRQAAFYLAEAGIDRALVELKSNSAWAGIGYIPLTTGGYEVAVATLSPTLRQVTSTGHLPSNVVTTPGYTKRQIEAVVSFSTPSIFDYALFVPTTLHLDSNAVIDSYDSRVGAYNASTNAGTDGDIGSNAAGAGTITLDSNAVVKGDAVAGPGANINTAIVTSGNSQITGTRGALVQPKSLTCESFPSGTASGSLTLTSNEIQTLPAGTYRYSSVNLASNAQLRVTGDVTIYVEQSVKLNSNASLVTSCGGCDLDVYKMEQAVFGTPSCGSCSITLYVDGLGGLPGTPVVDLDSNTVMSAGNKPGQFALIITSTTGDQTLDATSNFDSNTRLFGTINAPHTKLRLDSNAELFGAVLVKEADLNSNARIHYDVSLKEPGQSGSSAPSLVSWRDLN